MALKTLTRAEFKQKRPEGRYGQYLKYVKNRRAKQVPATGQKESPYSTLAPTPPPKLRQEAAATVAAGTSPLLANIRNLYKDQRDQASGVIGHYTKDLAGFLSGFGDEARGVYDRAEAESGATTDALRAAAGRAGATDAGFLDAAARQINAPDSSFADAAAGLGRGIAGTEAATGANAMQALIQQGAAQEGYATGLDERAALGGLQSLRALLGASQKQEREAIGDVTARVPGAVADAYQGLTDREFQKAVALQGFNLDTSKLEASALEDQADANALLTTPDPTWSQIYGEPRNAYGQPLGGEPLPGGPRGVDKPKAKYTAQQKQAAFRSAHSKGLALAQKMIGRRGASKADNPDTIFVDESGPGDPNPVGWVDALGRVISLLEQTLKPYGYNDAKIARAAQAILEEAGYSPVEGRLRKKAA